MKEKQFKPKKITKKIIKGRGEINEIQTKKAIEKSTKLKEAGSLKIQIRIDNSLARLTKKGKKWSRHKLSILEIKNWSYLLISAHQNDQQKIL